MALGVSSGKRGCCGVESSLGGAEILGISFLVTKGMERRPAPRRRLMMVALILVRGLA